MRFLHATGLATVLLATPTLAGAPVFGEVGDAGTLPADAQVLSGAPGTSVEQIDGFLDFDDANLVADVDTFGIFIPDTSQFSAEVTLFDDPTSVDTQIFLFGADGTYLLEDDDGGTGPLSAFALGELTGPGGLFYLAITDYPNRPLESIGSVVTGFDNNYSAAEEGNYSIRLTGATVVEPAAVIPLPATLPLMLGAFALAGLVGRRRVV